MRRTVSFALLSLAWIASWIPHALLRAARAVSPDPRLHVASFGEENLPAFPGPARDAWFAGHPDRVDYLKAPTYEPPDLHYPEHRF